MRFGADSAAPRRTIALSLSLLLHLTFAFVILVLVRHEVAPPPLEISIFEGPLGPASPPPGEKSAEPGPVGPPRQAAKPVEAPPKASSAAKAKTVAAHPHPLPKLTAAERPDRGFRASVRKTGPAPETQVLEAVQSIVTPRTAPSEGAPASETTPDTAHAKADVAVDSVMTTGQQASASVGADIGSAVLPGPGDGGSGWNSGDGGWGVSGGGAGRGGFSVTGAGAGGAGRSYASIWEWTQRYLASLRSAYNNALRNDAALRGVIVVRYEILPSGAVGDVTTLSSQLRDPHLEQEVMNQIRGWRYPAEPSGSVLVTWPFSFRPPS